VWTLADATDCATIDGNPKASTINTAFGGDWENEGELEDGDTADGLFAASVVDGWGNLPLSGTWTINPTFWTKYSSAVISIHVGGGRFGDSGVMFLVDQGATSGTWSGTQGPNVNGGGLSNIKLWGSGEGGETEVPEPASLALLGLGLLGLGFARRRVAG
jgi:PEP-CTERM motif